ncbi:MAG: hypothetical protein AAB739_02715 [Patescibacteria group bacterium]
MRGTTNLKIQSTCPDFYDHGEDLVAGFLSMADTPVNLKNKTELLPEMTTSILETAYKEDGCTDEIKASAFKQFARNYLRTEGRGSLETIFNEIIRLEEPVSLRNYLLGIYRKLRDEFEKQFDAKSFAGKRVEDTAARTGEKAKTAIGLELDPETEARLGYAQVDPKRDIGGRGTNP